MKTKMGGNRCCPKCGATEFIVADCNDDAPMLNGRTVKCVSCEWEGFALQLTKKPGADSGKLSELAASVERQAMKSYKPTEEE